MLVLSRKLNDAVIIGDDVEVRVVSIQGDKVKLGVTAPPDVSVHRTEVYLAIKRERERNEREGQDNT